MEDKLQFPYTRRILTSPNFPASASREGIKVDALLSPSIKSATRARDGSIGQLQPFKTACKRGIWLLFILLPKRGSRNCAVPCQHRDERGYPHSFLHLRLYFRHTNSLGTDLVILVRSVAIGELTSEIALEKSRHHLCPVHHSPAQPEGSQRFSPSFEEDHATALPQAWVKRKLLFLNPL